MSPSRIARTGDSSFVPSDSHGCSCCAHSAQGPAVSGSVNVLVNNKHALRVDDHGVHASCCGANRWVASVGAKYVLVNGRPAHRLADEDRHCGGLGKTTQGSPDVLVGGPKSRTDVCDIPDWIRFKPKISGRTATNVTYELVFHGGEIRDGTVSADGRIEEQRVKGRRATRLKLTF